MSMLLKGKQEKLPNELRFVEGWLIALCSWRNPAAQSVYLPLAFHREEVHASKWTLPNMVFPLKHANTRC